MIFNEWSNLIDVVLAVMFVAVAIYSLVKKRNRSVSLVLCGYFLVTLLVFYNVEGSFYADPYYFVFVGCFSLLAIMAIFLVSIYYESQESVKASIYILISIMIMAFSCALEEGRGYSYLYDRYSPFMFIAEVLLLIVMTRGINGTRRKRYRNNPDRFVNRVAINREIHY